MNVRDLFDMTGRVAIVTGGGRGIGLECAEALAEAGAKLLITGRRKQWLDEATSSLRRAGTDAHSLEADVSDPEDVRRTVETAVERFGAIDVLVNNAGIAWLSPSLEHPLDKWRMVLDVNLTGVFLMSQAVAPRMIGRGGGAIVNVSSIAGQLGLEPELQDTVSYNASKGGVDALTRDLAVKWARHNIRVNAIAPGYFPTRMTSHLVSTVEDRLKDLSPFHRLGRAGELKGAVLFLASRASDFVTGHVLNVDGGASIW